MKQARRHNDHGFTLTEMLVTVTIVIVLFALAMIPISKMRREVRQTELDSRAELIFMAAQNQLTQLQAAGRTSAYQGGLKLGYVPEDAENENEKYDPDTLSYVTSDGGMESTTSPAANILPEGKVDAELRNAHWVIEYDASSASVYAVFYSEQESNFYTADADKMNPLRARNYRLQQGAKIGYYGGDSVLSYDTSELDAKAEIVNGDQLLLKITCNRLLGESGFLDPTFTVTLRDESGHTAEVKLANNEIVKNARSIEATLVLDNLAEGEQMRFAEQERFKSLVPGENLTISVNVSVDNDLVEPAVIENITTNSLFADASDGSNGRTAVITCGRHLQNLDKDSGLNSQTVQNRAITAAVQEQDVEFKTEAEDGWKVLYDDMTFKPIENENLTSYDSTYQSMSNAAAYHPVIYDLTAAVASGDAGLFAAFEGDLKNIRLAGATITGSGNVGGLVGKLSGQTMIEGCWVYLSSARNHAADKTEKDLWLDGAVTGGLVGNAGSGTLTIKNSFAATVLNGKEAAGGLIGKSGIVTIEHSYADCYVYTVTKGEDGSLTAATTGVAGGLIGSCAGTSNIVLRDCYAAGFLKGGTTAGLVAGEFSGEGDMATNVYTACAPLDGTSLSYIIGKKEGVDAPGVQNVFYLSDVESNSAYSGLQQVSYADWSGSKIPDASKMLSDGTATAFTTATSTTPYNLMEGLGLTRYSYPALTDLPHYGDWQAQFENESLAYYEKYTGDSYGFSGGNISTLKTDGTVAVGDGYGLLYETEPTADVKVTVGGKTYTLEAKSQIKVTAANKGENKTYYLLPLPAKLVQEMGVGNSFYTKLTVAEGDKTFYYNPHFANTAAPGTDSDVPDTPERVEVRTARQLNALSAYYDEYVKDDSLFAENTAFVQGTNIDYSRYDWQNFGKDGKDGKSVSEQTPIGASAAQPFRYSYNGSSYQITGVSFTGKTCVGLFGYNTGTLSNIIITTNKPMNNEDGSVNSEAPTAKVTSTVQLNTVYVGVLAGWNQTGGVISNCAVSGYNLTGYAYSGSTSYIGGLVGFNAGAIRASSAVTPLIKGTGNLVQSLSIGGLVGGNGGQIRRSYALAAINVMEVSGNVTIAGFAGGNVGTIRDSYCATAMTSAGAATYGFAPASGSLNNCYFLTGGTYTFAGKVYLYDYDADVTVSGATGLSSKELAELSLDGFGAIADAAHSVNHPNTAIDETEKAVYPYPGSVTGRDGARTHYGDWVTDADLGTLGVIYWEKEEGGSNDGYHFSFIGFEDGVQQKADSSLCEAHDDGGKITDYGYGYYWKDTGNEPELEAALSPLNKVNDSGTFALGAKSTGKTAGSAAAELEKQVPGYNFVTYQTGEGADRMRLLSSKTANGQWRLTQEDQSGAKLTFRFLLNPFFANSYSYVDEKDAKTPGTEELAYQVRSVEQLQFINWSYSNGKGSTTADVTSTNYKTFPYLQYATRLGQNSQTKTDSLRGDTIGGPRTVQTWKQTHDVNGTDLSAPTDGTKNAKLHPIAGAVYYSEKDTGGDNYELILYNWFGGNYDGRNYYIKNIRIESYCYNVGLFGTTVGAEIGNIVLYSDNDSIIQRSSKPTPYKYSNGRSDPATYQTSYALGGLVGIAYDYASNNTSAEKSTINNCAIAGYSIQDNSQNKLRLGEAVVGGLFGVSSTNLENCSAVVDIEINCTHRWGTVTHENWEKVPFKEGDLNSAKYGNFIRVGGLVGGLQLSATNCYTGGSITVSDETLKERVVSGKLSDLKDGTSYTKVVRSEAGSNDKRPTTYVYVAGVGGSGFAANFQNFTNESSTFDGAPRYHNCYTYMDLPDMKGTITGITLIGSAADRYSWTTATISNCYYLKSVKDNIKFSEASKCYFDDNYREWYSSLHNYFNDKNNGQERINAMLYGDMTHMGTHIGGEVKAITRDGLTGLTYAQMSEQTGRAGLIKTENNADWWLPSSYDTFKDALNQNVQNGPFDWVSVEENNASIHGKYSFPGSDSELRGQDYPFPTVLTQTDIFGATVHLHYGRWPKVGMFWKDGITTLDLIADYVQAAGKSQIETQLVLNNTGLTLDANDVENVTFTYGNGATESDVASARVESVVSETTPAFNVVLEGKAPGAVEVTATFTKNDKTYTARLTLTVTAELNVTLTPAIVDEYVGDETMVKLQALNSRNEPVTSNIVWALVSDDEKIATASSVDTDSTTKIMGVSEGETSIHVTATVTLGGKTYTGTNVLGVTVSQQGVLGIANTASAEYVEGKLARDLKGWYEENATSAAGPAKKTYPDNGTAAPVCESTLFLYGRGQQAKLSSFDVAGITVTAKETVGTGTKDVTYDVLDQSNQSKYTVTVGTVSENGKDTVLPLTVRGWQQGEITLTVTLTDRRAEAAVAKYELSIPYTLTEADTQVTATFAGLNGEPVGTQTVGYGGQANAPTISEDLLAELEKALPEGSSFGNLSDPNSWEPSLTSPLYIDTVFRPKYEADTASADDE